MSRTLVVLDFVPARAPGRTFGMLLLVLGAAGVIYAFWDYQQVAAQRTGLELRIDALQAGRSIKVIAHGDSSVLSEAAVIANELNTPWSQLLLELETASRDQYKDIALLSIESDRDKRRIHVIAESRNLQMALGYVQRLQTSRALRYPTLDSHEVQSDDPEHPVKFQITAEWRQTS